MIAKHRSGFGGAATRTLAGVVGSWATLFGVIGTLITPPAHADVQGDKELAFIIQVFMRPGSYHFGGPSDALSYGYGICRKLADGRGYPQLITDVQGDFNNPDNYQASYLVDRAANELCPEMIWQLRKSAAGYRPPAPMP